MRIGHPLGLNALNAILLVGDESVRLPTNDPSWQETSFHRPSELFLWEIGNDVEKIMLLARIPTVLLGMVLAALVFRWARDASRNRWIGLLAMAFIALDPNILAHTRLTTTDFGITAGAALAGYTLWRYLVTPTTLKAIYAGIGFGLLNNTKFTAGLFVPLFALVILCAWLLDWRMLGWSNGVKRHAKFVLLFPLISFLTLWASYGFQIGTLPNSLPAMPQLAGLTLPLAHHLEQLLDIGNRSTKGAASYVLGDYSRDGWWYYFPVAFALKTPFVTLLAIGVALVKQAIQLVSGQLASHKTVLATLIPAFGFLAIGMTTSVNLGYRHLLPMLPFLVVFAAVGFDSQGAKERRGEEVGGTRRRGDKERRVSGKRFPKLGREWVAIGVFGWQLVATLWIAPDYLAYFNVLAGGPDNGWRSLVDSNIDWGQDLAQLATYVEREGVDEIWLSYFGEGRPDYYGIPYRGLTSYPPRLVHPAANPLYPKQPAPGVYAISATNLVGALFDDKNEFAWFRVREPDAKIGYSIFVYDVPADSAEIPLLLLNVRLQDMPPDVYNQIGTNALRPIRYHSADTAVYPATDGIIVTQSADGRWSLGDFPRRPLTPDPTATSFDMWTFHQQNNDAMFQNGVLQLKTTWQVDVESRAALRIFVHALDTDGNIMGQSDVLNVLVSDLVPGDVVEQQHRIKLDARPHTLRIGLYDWQTGERFGEPLVLPFER